MPTERQHTTHGRPDLPVSPQKLHLLNGALVARVEDVFQGKPMGPIRREWESWADACVPQALNDPGYRAWAATALGVWTLFAPDLAKKLLALGVEFRDPSTWSQKGWYDEGITLNAWTVAARLLLREPFPWAPDRCLEASEREEVSDRLEAAWLSGLSDPGQRNEMLASLAEIRSLDRMVPGGRFDRWRARLIQEGANPWPRDVLNRWTATLEEPWCDPKWVPTPQVVARYASWGLSLFENAPPAPDDTEGPRVGLACLAFLDQPEAVLDRWATLGVNIWGGSPKRSTPSRRTMPDAPSVVRWLTMLAARSPPAPWIRDASESGYCSIVQRFNNDIKHCPHEASHNGLALFACWQQWGMGSFDEWRQLEERLHARAAEELALTLPPIFPSAPKRHRL